MKIRRKLNKAVSTYLGFRNRRNTIMRKKLDGLNFSVFSNNCLGGVFLHDAGMRFNSPLVNLAMDGKSFLAFLEQPEAYLEPEFQFLPEGEKPFPVGWYRDIRVSFVHYSTKEDAVAKWIERSKRIIWDDIYVIATGHDGMETPDCMERFDRLSYKNKVMFTHCAWPQYSWAKQVKILEHEVEMPPLPQFATMTGKRLYDTAFDLAEWIADCEAEKKSVPAK